MGTARRGEYKTPGGKLVGVTVECDDDGRLLACHVDGDFFVDGGDERDMRGLITAIERALMTGYSAGTILRDGDGVRILGADSQAFDIAFSRAMHAGRQDARRMNPMARVEYTDAAKSADDTGGNAKDDSVGNGPAEGADITDICTDMGLRDVARRRWGQLHIRVFHDRPRTPADQMTIDERMARDLAAGNGQPALRIWEWSASAVIIGHFQSRDDEVDVDQASREGITVVRRCTGGGAMFVEPGNTITYSLYAPLAFVRGVDIARSYRLCDQWLVDALGGLGLDVRFSGLNDLASRHGKIGGAAQRRFPPVHGGPGAVLHHVTLAYDIDAEKMGRVLRVSREKMSDKAVRSASKRVDPLRSQTGMDRETLIGHLITAARAWGYNGSGSK